MTPEFDFKDYKSYKQPLSEAFIVCHVDHVDWLRISQYQKLSEEFIERHADRVRWGWKTVLKNL